MAATTFTVQARNSGGPASASLTFAIRDGPLAPAYSSPVSYTVGQAISPNRPANLDGSYSSWQVSPALPVGLTQDPATGTVTGTPTQDGAPATCTVTVENGQGASSTELQLGVAEAPPLFSYTSPVNYTRNLAIPPQPAAGGRRGRHHRLVAGAGFGPA